MLFQVTDSAYCISAKTPSFISPLRRGSEIEHMSTGRALPVPRGGMTRSSIVATVAGAILASAGCVVAYTKLNSRLARLPPSRASGTQPSSPSPSAESTPLTAASRVRLISSSIKPTIPTSFAASRTVKEVVNRVGHDITEDSRSVEIRVSGVSGVSRGETADGSVGKHDGARVGDEEILAIFARAFFSGVVLAPERMLLGALELRLTKFTRKPSTSSPFGYAWRCWWMLQEFRRKCQA